MICRWYIGLFTSPCRNCSNQNRICSRLKAGRCSSSSRMLALRASRRVSSSFRRCLVVEVRVYLRSQKCWDIRQKAPNARRMSAETFALSRFSRRGTVPACENRSEPERCASRAFAASSAGRARRGCFCGMQANATQQTGLFGRIEQRWGIFRYTLSILRPIA